MQLLDPKSRALITAGLLRPIDWAFFGLLLLETLTILQWWIFGSPTSGQLLVVFLMTLVVCELWVAVLVFRIGVIVLEARADIKMMPMAAAQLVQAARLGNAPTMKKP